MKAIFLISCLLIVGFAEFEFSDITNLGNTIVDGVVSAQHSVENLAKEGIDAIGVRLGQVQNVIKDGVNFVTGDSKPAATAQPAPAAEPAPTPVPATAPVPSPVTPQPQPVLIVDPIVQPLPELVAVPVLIRGIPLTPENMAAVASSMNQQVKLIEAQANEKKNQVTEAPVEKEKSKEEESTSEDIQQQQKEKRHHRESLKIEKKEEVDEERVRKHAKDLKARTEGKEHEHKQMKESKMSHEEWKQRKEEKAKKMRSYREKHEESKKERHDRKEFTTAELVEMWAKKHYKTPKTEDSKKSEPKDSVTTLNIPLDLEIHSKFSTNLRKP